MKKEEVKKIEENKTGNNRRDFIKNTALAAAAFYDRSASCFRAWICSS